MWAWVRFEIATSCQRSPDTSRVCIVLFKSQGTIRGNSGSAHVRCVEKIAIFIIYTYLYDFCLMEFSFVLKLSFLC